MSTDSRQLVVDGIDVEIVRKQIKNLHLAVYPPDGRVRLAIPLHLDDEAARLAVVARLAWVHRKRAAVIEQSRETWREIVSGESHFVSGDRYRMEVVEDDSAAKVEIRGNRTLRLQVRPNASRNDRLAVLEQWYRARLKSRISELIEDWSPKLGVDVHAWGVKRMKTRWGSCSPAAGRIWINLQLAKKSDRCLEYIVVHEMVHLLEKNHNSRFVSLMNRHMPSWKTRRDELNQSPLGYEHWKY